MLTPYHQWPVENISESIYSVYVASDNNHIFVGIHAAILEYTELGDIVCCCKLAENDITSVSPQILIVACGEERLCFLERKESPFRLEIKQFIPTEKIYISLSCLNEAIYACDVHFRLDHVTETGSVQSLNTEKMVWEINFYHRLCVDVSTGNIWMLKYDESQKLFSFSKEGELIEAIENIENQEIHDICIDESGHFYFCNNKGIYSLLPLKQIYKFERQSQDYSKIFVLKEKLFVSFKIDAKNYIKVFTLSNFQPT